MSQLKERFPHKLADLLEAASRGKEGRLLTRNRNQTLRDDKANHAFGSKKLADDIFDIGARMMKVRRTL